MSDIEQQVAKPLRSHGWNMRVVCQHDHHSAVEVEAAKQERVARFAFIYSTATDNLFYKQLAARNERIFYHGQAYQLDVFARDVDVPVEPMGDFFPVLVALNKELEPDRTPSVLRPKKKRSKRITDENPQRAVLTRLEQFTSAVLCQRLIERRYADEGIQVKAETVRLKAEGVAFSVRSALDYFRFRPDEALNKRVLGLYYGALAFAFAEMLASPSGADDLDAVEAITKQGHGLYTLGGTGTSFPDLTVGVLATGFMPRWLDFLGYDIGDFPKRKPRNDDDLQKLRANMHATLGMVLGSFPEIDDLYRAIIDAEPSWMIPAYHLLDNKVPSLNTTERKTGSTYCRFTDVSSRISEERLISAGFPIAEVRRLSQDEREYAGSAFRARVDHEGFDIWWDVIPTHSSPGQYRTTVLLPSLGGMRDYRVLATTALYSLSIAVRYMPSLWRRVEGGDNDQYLALVKAALAAWERVLPQQFLESIADERINAVQPGGLF